MTEYTKRRKMNNSKARLEGNPQRRPKPQIKPIEPVANPDDVSLSEEEQKSLFTGMLGCIVLLSFIIVVLTLIIIF